RHIRRSTAAHRRYPGRDPIQRYLETGHDCRYWRGVADAGKQRLRDRAPRTALGSGDGAYHRQVDVDGLGIRAVLDSGERNLWATGLDDDPWILTDGLDRS